MDVKRISVYAGHASVSFTLDRYSHLLPEAQDEAVAMIDAYMQRADSASRVAALD